MHNTTAAERDGSGISMPCPAPQLPSCPTYLLPYVTTYLRNGATLYERGLLVLRTPGHDFTSAYPGHRRQLKCANYQGNFYGRVALEACASEAPTDPDMQISRIRLFGPRLRYATVAGRMCG